MNAFDELAGYRFSPGRDYDKRSVETFRARVLNLVDDLLNQVTQLQDEVADLRSREAKALEEHEAPVVPTTWLEAIAGEPDHRTPTADVVPFPVSDVPPSPGYNGGFVRPFVASTPSEPDVVETAPAAFPAPPVMAWLADLEQPPGDVVDVPAAADEPPAYLADEVDDPSLPRSSTADLLRSVPTPPLPPVIADLDAELVDLTASFHATESALVLDTAGDTDDEVLAPIVTLPVAPTPPAVVVPPHPPPQPPPAVEVSVPLPPAVAVAVPPPPPPPPPAPVVVTVPTPEREPVVAESWVPAPEPEPVAAEPLITFEPEPALVPEPERAPEPVGVGAAVGRYERLPIVLDDGLPDDGILPAPVRHWSGWMRD